MRHEAKVFSALRASALAMKGALPMSSIKEKAQLFFDACETGKGWEGCEQYCHADASFLAQAGALKGVDTSQTH